MIAGFKKFIMQGNVIDLAVGIVIGGVFGAVVKSFTDDILMQIVAAIIGKPDFANLSFTLNDSVIRYGAFLNTVIAFLVTAAAVYFAVVVPMNAMIERRKAKGGAEEEELTNEEKMVALLERIAAK